MGWIDTSEYRGGGLKNWFDRKFAGEDAHCRWEILKSALVGLRTYYAACRRAEKATGGSIVFALVVKVDYNPRAADGLTPGYKDMDEGMGPNEVGRPLAILDSRGPSGPERYGADWRERVRAWHARQVTRPKPGDIVVFASPLSFTDGAAGSRFRAERVGKRGVVYRNLETGLLDRIRAIANRDFVVENRPAAATSQADRRENRS